MLTARFTDSVDEAIAQSLPLGLVGAIAFLSVQNATSLALILSMGIGMIGTALLIIFEFGRKVGSDRLP